MTKEHEAGQKSITVSMVGAPEAKEIEITPQMMEAGFQVLRSSGIADEYLEADRRLVAQIYRAMVAAPRQ